MNFKIGKLLLFAILELYKNANKIQASQLRNLLYFDNIPHLESDVDSLEIENAYKDLVAMKEVQYIYKRDFYWRTWRRIINATEEVLVHYRSQSISEINCTICHSGFWVIEDSRQLCQYEISAMKNYEELNVFTPDHPNKYSISLNNLINQCGNPIKTKMRITYKYFSNQTVICQGREFCEINTLYSIYPEFVVFQIVNSTNNIIYSKIMKAGNRNFICINNCGTLRQIINKNENGKIKKENNVNSENFNISNINKKYNGSRFIKTQSKTRITKSNMAVVLKRITSTLSPCKRLQLMQIMEEDIEFHPFL